MIVKRDKRENEIDCFNFETIFVHNIDFLDVVNDITNDDFFDIIIDVVNDVIDVKKAINFIEVDENEKFEINELFKTIDV